MAGAVFGEVQCDSWRQAQYLLKLQCQFLRQAQYSAKFWEIDGARNVVFFRAKCVTEMAQVSSCNGRARDDGFMAGPAADCPRIMFG